MLLGKAPLMNSTGARTSTIGVSDKKSCFKSVMGFKIKARMTWKSINGNLLWLSSRVNSNNASGLKKIPIYKAIRGALIIFRLIEKR